MFPTESSTLAEVRSLILSDPEYQAWIGRSQKVRDRIAFPPSCVQMLYTFVLGGITKNDVCRKYTYLAYPGSPNDANARQRVSNMFLRYFPELYAGTIPPQIAKILAETPPELTLRELKAEMESNAFAQRSHALTFELEGRPQEQLDNAFALLMGRIDPEHPEYYRPKAKGKSFKEKWKVLPGLESIAAAVQESWQNPSDGSRWLPQ